MKRTLFRNVAGLYGPTAPARLITIYKRAGGPFRYLVQYWSTQYFPDYEPDVSEYYAGLRQFLFTGMVLQVIIGLSLLYAGVFGNVAGGIYGGAAVLLAYPIVWAHILFLLALGWVLLHPKRYGKKLICLALERQVRLLRERNDFTLIAVAGSVGKTSTKLAVAELLGETKRVRFQEGNYNDRLTVPLVFFNESEPGIYNLPAWFTIYRRNRKQLQRPYPYDVVVVELGTDGPGQMKDFAYLRPDLTIVTSVAEEHMEYFKTLDAVAAEELTVFTYSTQVLVNTDDVAAAYLAKQSFESYGTATGAQYHTALSGAPTRDGQKLQLKLKDTGLTVQSRYFGAQGAKIVLAAAAVGHMLELDDAALKAGLENLRPFSGRMQLLPGVHDSTLIDDTYNASPLAVRAALDVLYALKTPQRIAVLGSMNELGKVSAEAHRQVGAYCDPEKLDMVVTVGKEAKAHLAPAAASAGCVVHSFDSPYKAGEFIRRELKKHAVILAKGSQNGVFAEEALKPLLADKDDVAKLVRQSAYWLGVKRAQFGE